LPIRLWVLLGGVQATCNLHRGTIPNVLHRTGVCFPYEWRDSNYMCMLGLCVLPETRLLCYAWRPHWYHHDSHDYNNRRQSGVSSPGYSSSSSNAGTSSDSLRCAVSSPGYSSSTSNAGTSSDSLRCALNNQDEENVPRALLEQRTARQFLRLSRRRQAICS